MNEQSHNIEQLKQMFRHITVWRRGAERAPHKPLLLLYALGKCQRGAPRAIPYAEVDPALQRLLRAFGPPRRSYHSEYPFWRLQQDGIWELQGAEHVVSRQSNNDAKGGPSIETNGLALCILHHKLFDRGAFTIALNRQVQVSEYAHGATGFTEWLLAYHGKPIRPPQSPQYLPREEYLSWHMQQVFRGPARHLVGEDSSRERGA